MTYGNQGPVVTWEQRRPLDEVIADEPLLDVLGTGAVLLGAELSLRGRPDAGAQWAALGFGAIAGKRVLAAALTGRRTP